MVSWDVFKMIHLEFIAQMNAQLDNKFIMKNLVNIPNNYILL